MPIDAAAWQVVFGKTSDEIMQEVYDKASATSNLPDGAYVGEVVDFSLATYKERVKDGDTYVETGAEYPNFGIRLKVKESIHDPSQVGKQQTVFYRCGPGRDGAESIDVGRLKGLWTSLTGRKDYPPTLRELLESIQGTALGANLKFTAKKDKEFVRYGISGVVKG